MTDSLLSPDNAFMKADHDDQFKKLLTPPTFSDVEEHRKHLKERLVLALRIFAKYNFDHIIVSTVSLLLKFRPR